MKNLVMLHAFEKLQPSKLQMKLNVVSQIIQGMQRFHHEQRAKKSMKGKR